MVGSVSAAVAAFLLLVVRGEYNVGWLANAEGPLDELFFVGLAVAAVAWTIERWRAVGVDASAIGLRLVVMATAIGFTCAAAELIARYVFRDVRSSSDGRSYFAGRALPVRVNSQGFRDPEIPPKNAGRYRIAIVGDSITWGQGIAESQRFSNLLGSSLGAHYEVLNFGIPGHDMPQHLETLDRALGVSPDYILLQLYINDFETQPMMRPRALPILPWRAVDRRLYRSSVLYDLLAGQWAQLQEATGLTESYTRYMRRNLEDPESPSSRQVFGMLRQFIARAREAGVPSGTVLFPNPSVLDAHYPFGYLHDRVRGICSEEHVPCVDLRAAFASTFRYPPDMWVSRFDPHPNARANRRASAEILHAFAGIWEH
jgi:lysophospholipase L1-like esterase